LPPWTESSCEAASWALALATQNNQKQATINGQPKAMATTSSSHSSDSFSISTVQQTMQQQHDQEAIAVAASVQCSD